MANACIRRPLPVLDLVLTLTTTVVEADIEAISGMFAPVMTTDRTAAVVGDVP